MKVNLKERIVWLLTRGILCIFILLFGAALAVSVRQLIGKSTSSDGSKEMKRSGICLIQSAQIWVYDFATPIVTRKTVHASPVDFFFPFYAYVRLGMASGVTAKPTDTGDEEILLSRETLDIHDRYRTCDTEKENEQVYHSTTEGAEKEEKEEDLPEHAAVEVMTHMDLSDLSDPDTLIQTFYVVDSSTSVPEGLLDAEKFMSLDMRIEKTEGPQILIYHTHSQEGFRDSAEGDADTTIVGVGEHLKEILEERYGFRVLHHTENYDVPDRNKAYSRAKPEIEKVLKDNPSIQLVIDLHRDAMPEEKRLVTEIDGKPTAKIMFFNGLSRLKKTGEISYLPNENLQSNLALSFQMEKAAMEYYPDFTRKIYLKSYRYNMHLKDKYLLVELGAQNNTLEEAMNACEPLAYLLSLVVGEKP